MEVTLMDMLAARERRVFRQQSLLAEYGKPIICFTMNIAGPVKDSPEIRRGFSIGKELLFRQLPVERIHCLHFEQVQEHTGSEAFFVMDADGETVKAMTCGIEEAFPLGRLFDLDVIGPSGEKYGRDRPRRCLICGQQAQVCARSRTHTVPELQRKTSEILKDAIEEWNGDMAAQAAVRALLYEVGTTPKPGLVDRSNSGSHKDMDFFSFQSSAAALYPYFRQCAIIGMQTKTMPAGETLCRLRLPGKLAEGKMYRATGGANTHKGAIFSLGILCGALGRLDYAFWSDSDRVLEECASMASGLTESDFGGLTKETAVTAGQRLYLEYGITGVRGQAEAGFPAVRELGLPKLEAGLARGLSINGAACAALLSIISGSVDTNLIHRGSYEMQKEAAAQIADLLENEPFPTENTIRELDFAFINRNLSPGGSADLLAMTLMLHFLKEEH